MRGFMRADTGRLFNVTTSGTALGQTVSYTLCLTINGKNPLSCQNYSTSNATLSIKTTSPRHTYHYAGIKINTPGFRYTGQGFRASTRKKIISETAAEGYVFIGTVSDTHAATGTVSPTGGGTTTLSVSMTDLALSITGLTLNGKASGQPRSITITNTGDAMATRLSIDYPTWPAATTAASDCGASLAIGATCTITVTPSTTPTSNCSLTGIAPTPGVITVNAGNAPDVTTNVVVLNYGCIYQGGYLFEMTEPVDTEESIGGTVVTQEDQAANGVVWSSNGASSISVSYDSIPGIAETSTTGSSVPTYADAQLSFNSTYSSTFPFPSSGSFSSCNGRINGACNSTNILTLYNTYITNYGIVSNPPYTLSAGPTTTSYYAAGLCTATISGYSDWYLPAICEMGPASNGSGCDVGTQNMVNQLPDLLGDPNVANPSTSCNYGANCLAGNYWSSTEDSSNPQRLAWNQYFAFSGSYHGVGVKVYPLGVRCSRALTL